MEPRISENLVNFLKEHLNLQIKLVDLISLVNSWGYNGFSHWLSIQFQDEVLHQRKIINYFLLSNQNLKINYQSFLNLELIETNNFKDINSVFSFLEKEKQKFLSLTENIVGICREEKDNATLEFLTWFLADFKEEIDEIQNYKDNFSLSNGNHYPVDKKMGKKEEPDTKKVIQSFYKF
jgi:ferritin